MPAQIREARPFTRFHPVHLSAARWTTGFWADRFRLCREVTIPVIKEALESPENSASLRNFYVAAGLQEGAHQGTDWSDGDCYKWMEAVAYVYNVTSDAHLDEMLDELIAVIAQAQEPDGYICTQIQLTEKGRWQLRRHHELYNMGHLMTAASVHYWVTGKKNFLTVAQKLADYLYTLFQPRPPELAHYGWNPSNIMGLVDLYRATGDTRYLELAGIFVDMRGSAPPEYDQRKGWVLTDGGDQNQDRVPLRQETEAVGHAVTATYLYCGAADVYAETGEEGLRIALERIWNDVVQRKLYITGGVGPLHHGTSIRGDMVHEAFSYAYDLPNATAYNETCANIGQAMWARRMLAITGEAEYADVMEQVLYNTGLSGMSIDGKHFCYTNPLRWYGPRHRMMSHDAAARWFTFSCYCCPPQVARTLAQLHTWVYSLTDGELWIHLYGGSTLATTLADGSALRLTQATNYPWEGEIRIIVDEAPTWPLAVMLRVPGWARGAEIQINGRRVGVEIRPSSYVRLERSWRPGDVIELSLPMRPRLVRANPRVEQTRNQAAVMMGPLVYCLESVDLPDGVDLAQVHIPRDLRLAQRHDPGVLGGVTVLKGEARRLVQEISNDRLYAEIGHETLEPVAITLIPYYAWNNRGQTDMAVWLPLL